MKATVNIGFRTVDLEYWVDEKDLAPFSHEEKCKNFKNWELSYKSKKVLCKHSVSFDDADEWQSVVLFDGRTIDFHYDYINREEMDTKATWGGYIFQGYEYIEGEEQLYDNDVVDKVIIKW